MAKSHGVQLPKIESDRKGSVGSVTSGGNAKVTNAPIGMIRQFLAGRGYKCKVSSRDKKVHIVVGHGKRFVTDLKGMRRLYAYNGNFTKAGLTSTR